MRAIVCARGAIYRWLCCFLPCGISAAQSTLTTSYAGGTFLASLDGGVYFDLQVQQDLSLSQIDVNLHAPSGTRGSLEVWVRPGSWVEHVRARGDWVQVSAAALTSAGPLQPTPCLLSTPIGLPPGSYGVALHLSSVMPVYTFAFGPRTFGNRDLALVAGGSATQFLASAPFAWRVFNGTLHYTVGGGPYSPATVQSFGAGCNLGLVHDGAAFVQLAAAMPFPGGSTSSLLVLADGRVLFTDRGLVGTTLAPPSVQELLGTLPTLAAAWMDLAPLGSANVYVHADPVAGSTTLIWWHVPGQGAPPEPGNTFALTTYLDGRLELRFGAVQNPTDSCLVGFGAGAAARDPGPRDLSLLSTLTTRMDDPGLGLVAEGRPVLGTTTTLRLVDLPAGATLSLMLVGWRAGTPSVDLGPFGGPGCWVHVDTNHVSWTWLDGTASLALALPNDPGLLGVGLAAQGATMVPSVNALGAVTSNGLALTIGGV